MNLTLCLQVANFVVFPKSLDPDQDRPGSKPFDILIVFLKYIYIVFEVTF